MDQGFTATLAVDDDAVKIDASEFNGSGVTSGEVIVLMGTCRSE